jgi:hypothetical protein
VSEAAMMGEALDAIEQTQEYINVRKFSGRNDRERGESGLAVETGATEASAKERMSDRIHVR